MATKQPISEAFTRDFLTPMLREGDTHALSTPTAQALRSALGGEYGDMLHSLMAKQVHEQQARIQAAVDDFTPPAGEPLDMQPLNQVPEMIRRASETALQRELLPALQTVGLSLEQARECIGAVVDLLALEAGMRSGAVLVEHLEDSSLKTFGEKILMPVMGEDPHYVQGLMQRVPGAKPDADKLILSDVACEALELALGKHPQLVEQMKRSVQAQMRFIKGMIVPEVRHDVGQGGIRALGFRESMRPIVDKTVFMALHDDLSPTLHALGMSPAHQVELFSKLGAVLQIAAAQSVIDSAHDTSADAVLRAEKTQRRAHDFLNIAVNALSPEKEGRTP